MNNSLLNTYKPKNNQVNPLMHMMQMRAQDRMQGRDKREIDDRRYNNYNINDVKNILIKPLSIDKVNPEEIKRKHFEAEREFTPTLTEYWTKRHNQPYKNILKNEDYKKNFKQKEDLIVHKVTQKDKEGVEEDLDKLIKTKEEHDGELKVIYSSSAELSNKKKFEYENKSKYRIKYDPKNNIELKEDNLEYYKEEQQKLEQDKQKYDDILETLLSQGIINEEDKNEISKSVEPIIKQNPIKENPVKQNPIKENSIKVNPVKETRPVKESLSKESLSKENSIKESPIKENPIKESKLENNNDILSSLLNGSQDQVKDQVTDQVKVVGIVSNELRDKYKNRKK